MAHMKHYGIGRADLATELQILGSWHPQVMSRKQSWVPGLVRV